MPVLQCDHLAYERRQPPRERLESALDIRGADAGAELIDQCIVGRKVQGLAEQRSLVAHQVHDLLEMRGEDFEPTLLPGLEPVDLGARGRSRQPGDQRDRRRDGMVALTPHLAEVRDLPLAQALRVGLRAIEQPRDTRRGEERVVLGLEGGQLLASNIGAAARHHHGRIPAQQ